MGSQIQVQNFSSIENLNPNNSFGLTSFNCLKIIMVAHVTGCTGMMPIQVPLTEEEEELEVKNTIQQTVSHFTSNTNKVRSHRSTQL
jgi:hypothetical protein